MKIICDSGGTRTHNQQNRNLPFYPLNYGARIELRVTNYELRINIVKSVLRIVFEDAKVMDFRERNSLIFVFHSSL
jgi:hypothetical protein